MSNVPKLRFKEFSGEWEEKKLGSFLDESRIKGSTGKDAKKLTVKLWGKGVIPKKEIHNGSSKTQYYIRKNGQLMYGKLDFLNCAFGIVPEYLDGYESTLDAPAFDVKNIDSYFLLNRITQRNFYKKYGDIANGSRKAKRIHVETFLDMSINIPTIEEQEKISEFLCIIDKKIEKQQKKVDLLEEYKKGMMQKIFSRGIRFKDENGEEYPEWEEKKLGELDIKLTRGPFGSALKKEFMVSKSSNTYKVYEQKHAIKKNATIGDYYIDEKRYKQLRRFEVEPGDFIMSCSGTIGEMFKIPKDAEKGIINQALLKIRVGMNLNHQYFVYCFKKNLDGLETKGSGIKNITSIKFLKDEFILNIPIISEQQKIAGFLSKIDDKLNKEKEKLDLLKEWKKGLLQQMFV